LGVQIGVVHLLIVEWWGSLFYCYARWIVEERTDATPVDTFVCVCSSMPSLILIWNNCGSFCKHCTVTIIVVTWARGCNNCILALLLFRRTIFLKSVRTHWYSFVLIDEWHCVVNIFVCNIKVRMPAPALGWWLVYWETLKMSEPQFLRIRDMTRHCRVCCIITSRMAALAHSKPEGVESRCFVQLWL
jgi:hypothetical protein